MPKSPLLIYANQMLPVPTTLLSGMTQADLEQLTVGVGGIDKYSTSVFHEKILRYYYIPTIGVADLQAPLNNMIRSS